MTIVLLAKSPESCSFQTSQRVFKLVALLVPGFPSLDAKLYSPGETQRKEFSDLMIYRSGDLFSASLSHSLVKSLSSKIMPVRYGRFEMPKTLSKEVKA